MNKKILLLCSVVVVGLSSCRKDRSCVCSQNGAEIYKANYIRVKKSEAQTYCQAMQNTYSTGSGVTCVVQ